MKVKDIHGCNLEIGDLNAAIKIAKRCITYRHEDKEFSEFDERQKAYWTDLYAKLLAIKEELKPKT